MAKFKIGNIVKQTCECRTCSKRRDDVAKITSIDSYGYNITFSDGYVRSYSDDKLILINGYLSKNFLRNKLYGKTRKI